MPNEKYVDSSNVISIGYLDKDLYVKYNQNSIYVYFSAVEHYNKILSAPSAGKYLNAYVKQNYECKKIS